MPFFRKGRLHRYNPNPSKYGLWLASGRAYKNIPIEPILDDPFFKRSDQSSFMQLVDFCAYALLRRERPLASKSAYGLHEAFEVVRPILVLEATTRDPDGIIRP